MIRSHSRHSYPHNKMIPVDALARKRKLTSIQRGVMKRMHNRKVRYASVDQQ